MSTQEDRERQAFEAVFAPRGVAVGPAERSDVAGRTYVLDSAEHRWHGWIARAALSAPAQEANAGSGMTDDDRKALLTELCETAAAYRQADYLYLADMFDRAAEAVRAARVAAPAAAAPAVQGQCCEKAAGPGMICRDCEDACRGYSAAMQTPAPAAAPNWEHIAKVQNAKLMAMTDQPGGIEMLREVLRLAAPAEALARRFHEAYERLAPQFGYETRAETRAFDSASPNGRLMIAVCREIAAPAEAPAPAHKTPYDWPRKACPCGSVQRPECIERGNQDGGSGCLWERDPSLVPAHLRRPWPEAPAPAQPAELGGHAMEWVGELLFSAHWCGSSSYHCQRVRELLAPHADIAAEVIGREERRNAEYNRALAAAPAPAQAEQDARDAARYRWLRDQNKRMHYTTDFGHAYGRDETVDLIQIEVVLPAGEPLWTGDGHFDYPRELDRSIDEAIAAMKGTTP